MPRHPVLRGRGLRRDSNSLNGGTGAPRRAATSARAARRPTAAAATTTTTPRPPSSSGQHDSSSRVRSLLRAAPPRAAPPPAPRRPRPGENRPWHDDLLPRGGSSSGTTSSSSSTAARARDGEIREGSGDNGETRLDAPDRRELQRAGLRTALRREPRAASTTTTSTVRLRGVQDRRRGRREVKREVREPLENSGGVDFRSAPPFCCGLLIEPRDAPFELLAQIPSSIRLRPKISRRSAIG